MAGFFLVFGTLQAIDIPGFVKIYREYDLMAKYNIWYAYAYPFIEIALGLAYLVRKLPLLTNFVNLTIMFLGFVSILIKLIKKEIVPCACLGALFKHPLSLLSLFGNALMVAMAAWMLVSMYSK